MLYVFLIKPFKQWNFEKFQVFLAEFFHKKRIVLQWKQFKTKFSLNFCFASFDILKAVTKYFKKPEIAAKRFGLKKGLNLPWIPSLSISF